MGSSSKESDKCCVKNCDNTARNSKYGFYYFPSANPNYPHKVLKRELWLKALAKLEPDGSVWIPKKRSRICSFHFVGNKKSEHPESPSYIPTIFDNSTKTLKRATSSSNRFQRLLKRRMQNSVDSDLNIKKSKVSDARNLLANLSLQDEHSSIRDQATCDVETNVNFLSDDDDNTDNFQKSNTIFICINHPLADRYLLSIHQIYTVYTRRIYTEYTLSLHQKCFSKSNFHKNF
ncbi:uncharacterized protein LOC130671590 [Microplitis mediator]|uniref:uncharacterized protein LOC130671590 n=1 Tax=Microplitis mediator TaxID=375433 RepID=UPI002554DAF0|nr:uncharacterized protein LOC130671590 [Microplitis mediator]